MLKSRNQCGKKTIYLILMVKSYKFAAGISLAMLVTVLCLVGCEPATDKSSQDQAGDSGRPNVVLIITDDQGYGDLGVHGNPIISTPNMDALAEESIRLEDYHVAPTCAPTRAGLLTGRWHNRTGVWHTVMGRSMLRQDEVTLADMLAANGYRTAMIGKWHLGDNYPYRPHDRGFEYAYYNGGGGVGQTPDFWNNAYFDGSYFRNGQAEPAEGYVTDVFFDEAIAFIDSVRGGDKPFFVYLATNAPHGPMHAPPQYADLYADEGLSVATTASARTRFSSLRPTMGRRAETISSTPACVARRAASTRVAIACRSFCIGRPVASAPCTVSIALPPTSTSCRPCST
jgi:hypothetical protein